jgi:hypothetical protein
MKGTKSGYDEVPPDELPTALGEDDAALDLFELKQNLRSLQTYRSKRLLIANSIIFCASAFLLATTYIRSTPSTAQFVSKFSSYSPAREAVQYVSGTFNATQGKDSGYIGTSNETEEMWNWVTVDMGDQMITPEELKLVNKPETSVKTKDPNTGKEGYRIGLEVFHQLHCLNLVRKSTYRDHYKGKGDFAEEDEVKIRTHLGMDKWGPSLSDSCTLLSFEGIFSYQRSLTGTTAYLPNRSLSRDATYEYYVSSRYRRDNFPRTPRQTR